MPPPPPTRSLLPAVSAVAVGSLWSNAVGTVALRCLPDRLRIDLLRVGRFRAGFALIGAASPVRFEVPYRAVRGLVRSGPLLVLALDPRVARPYHRFALCRFSDAPHESLLGAVRASAALRLARALLPLAAGVALWWGLPEAWVAGPLGRAAASVLLGWLLWAAAGPLVAFAEAGGPRSSLLRDRFERALCDRLGLEPAPELALPARASAPTFETAEPRSDDPSSDLRPALRAAWGAAGRPRALAIVAGLGLSALLGAVVAVQRYGIVEAVVLPVDEGRAGLARAARARAADAATAVDARHRPCECVRAASPLWDGGIPVLSILLTPRRGSIEPLSVRPGQTVTIAHPGGAAASAGDGDELRAAGAGAPDQSRHRRRRSRGASDGPAPEVELDLAVVNNSSSPLEDVSLVVTFAQRSAQGARMAIMERGLAWPRPLGPAEAVKWRIEAEGTELRIDCRFDAMLGAGQSAAAEQFERLLDARLSPVRLHAVMMLAFLGDGRAREAAKALGPLTAREEQVRAEIVRTSSPLRACALSGQGDPSGLCVHNGTGELLRAVRITPAGLGRTGGEPSWTVADLFRPRVALRVDVPAGVAAGGFDVSPEPGAQATPAGPRVPVDP